MMQRKPTFVTIWTQLLASLVLAGSASTLLAADRAGAVSFVIGDARVQNAAGELRSLARGDAIDAGQVLVTGVSGHIHLQMVDGAFVSVRPQSRLRIEDYHYDAQTPGNNRIKFLLEEGVARSITGKAGAAAKQNYRLNTPLAAIGIRGTDFVVQTSAQITRVTVQSGAIDMAPLAGDCLASSFGPCSSATTRVLTAAMRNAYLELRSRNEAPLLVPAEKALDSPNLQSPPRPEEPRVSADKVNKSAMSSDTRDAVRDVAADTIKTKVDAAPPPVPQAFVAPLVTPPVVIVEAVVVPVVVAPPVVTPPVVVAPVVVVPPPATQFWWGRWSKYIRAGEEGKEFVTATAYGSSKVELAGGNDVFGMTRSVGDVVMPGSGIAKFQLADSEAYFMSNSAIVTAAQLSGASLTIDFGGRRYDTAFTLNGTGQAAVPIQSSGQVTFQGQLLNDINATTSLSGSLSKDASQAGFVFQRALDGGLSVFGATRWTR